MDQITKQQLIIEIYHYGQQCVAQATAQQTPDSRARIERATQEVADSVSRIKALLDAV